MKGNLSVILFIVLIFICIIIFSDLGVAKATKIDCNNGAITQDYGYKPKDCNRISLNMHLSITESANFVFIS